MNNNNPFLNILPSIDLHGYVKDMIYVPVDEFINDSIKLNHKKILIIHGKGEGILKEELYLRFKNDKRINKMYISSDNDGCTIIELK